MKKILLFLTLIIAISITGCSKPKTPAEQLIADIIEVYGGEAAMKKLDSYTSIWNIEVQMTRERGTATNFVEIPDNLRVELKYPTKSEHRFVRGVKAFKGYNASPSREVSGPQRDAMRLQLLRLYTPLKLKELVKKKAATLGEDRGYKTFTYVVDGLKTVYYINPSTNTIQITLGTLQMNGREMQFMTDYSDFKKVDGVLFHHTEKKYAAGVNTAVLFLKELKTNQTHSKDLFKD